MAINREKFSGEGIEQADGRKKSKGFERTSKREKHSEMEEFLGTIAPLRADILHSGNTLPKGKNPEKTLEEKLVDIETRIKSDEFSETEREFFETMAKKYPHELQVAKEKIEKRGGAIDGKWAASVRTSYINERKRLGLEKNKWGSKIPLASEKAEIFEKYLELKLPVGIPEEKPKDIPKSAVELNKEPLKDLNKENKHMEIPIKGLGAQIEADRAALKAAGMMPDAADPKSVFDSSPGGKKMEDAVRDQATINQRQINRARGFAPKGMRNIAKVSTNDPAVEASPASEGVKRQEEIQKAAWELFRNRQALDPENKETEPSEFDLRTAEAVYRAMQKSDEAEKPFHPPVVVSDSERERSVVPVNPEVYTAEPISGEPQQKVLEGVPEKSLEQLKADLDAKADVYATARGNARGSRGYLAKLLGISKNVEESGEVKKARLEYLQAKLEHSKAAAESAFKEYQDKLQNGTASPEELEALRIKWESISNYHNRASDIDLQGKFVEKTIEYYNTKGGFLGKVFGKYLDLYNNVYLKKVPPKVRVAISIAMMGGAVAGLAGAFGVAGGFAAGAALVSRPARFLLAPLMPAMTYTGTGKMMEKGLQLLNARKGKKRSAAFGEVVGKMKSGEVSVEDTRKNIMKLLEEQNKEYGDDLVKRGWREDRCEQARNYLTMFVGARAAWVIMSGTEAISSFFGNKGDMIGATQSAPKSSLYTEGSGRKTAITPEGMKAIENSDAGSPKLSSGDYEKIREHSYFSEPDAKMNDMRAPDAHAQMAELGNRELGYSKVYEGGGIEKSAQDIIRANPKAFGLDPNNPRFHGQVGDKAHELAEGMRKKFGLSHKVFDRIASHNIQEGNEIRVFQDPSSGKLNMKYNGAAFDKVLSPANIHGSGISPHDVSHGGANATQEIAPSKGSMPVEDVKPRNTGVASEHVKHGGGVAEHQPARGGGKIAGMEEIEARQHAAQAKYANAVRAEQEWHNIERPKVQADIARDLAIDNHKLYLANRGLLGDVFHKLGISEYYKIYDQPMNKWDDLMGPGHNIAQDVGQADVVNVSNESWKKLNDLHSILKYYNTSSHENIGECLRRALADSRIAPIGHGESIGAQVQQAINEILNNKK